MVDFPSSDPSEEAKERLRRYVATTPQIIVPADLLYQEARTLFAKRYAGQTEPAQLKVLCEDIAQACSRETEGQLFHMDAVIEQTRRLSKDLMDHSEGMELSKGVEAAHCYAVICDALEAALREAGLLD